MANKTSIEWTDYNWNFLRGCSRVSEGCRNCYAERQAIRGSYEARTTVAGTRVGPGPYNGLVRSTPQGPRWTGEISFHEDILLQPLRWTKPRKVFVNSMSDLFHEKVSDEILDKAFAVMALTPQHTYQILTKRPERMKAYFASRQPETYRNHWVPKQISSAFYSIDLKNWDRHVSGNNIVWPLPNVWLGVSVEDQKTADERIPLLLQTPAAIRWISAEPLLGPINLEQIANDHWANGHRDVLAGYLCGDHPDEYYADDAGFTRNPPDKWERGPHGHLDWVVVGGESGPGARPCDIGWIAGIVNQCVTANVPVFVKQLGKIPIMAEDAWRNAPTTRVLSYRNAKHVPNNFVGILMSDGKGGNIDEFPDGLKIREFPRADTLPNGRVSALAAEI